MNKYTFDFSKTSLDEIYQASHAAGIGAMLALYERVTVGGIRHLAPNEVFYTVAPQFKDAFDAWLHRGTIGDLMGLTPRAQIYDAPESDDNALSGLLDDIEGL